MLSHLLSQGSGHRLPRGDHHAHIAEVRALRTRLLQWRPDVFIGVDAPDFNLGLERSLKQAGIRTVQLNSHDAFLDCPTREQRAWVGDSVVHQMVHLATNTDWRLAWQYLNLGNSPRYDGILPMSVAGEIEATNVTIVPLTVARPVETVEATEVAAIEPLETVEPISEAVAAETTETVQPVEELVEKQPPQRLGRARVAREQRAFHDLRQIAQGEDRRVEIREIGLQRPPLVVGEGVARDHGRRFLHRGGRQRKRAGTGGRR